MRSVPARPGVCITMTDNALQIALACHKAWTAHHLEHALTYIAEDFVCDAPAGRIEGRDAYRAFMGPFVAMLHDARLIAAFGNDTTALIMYDTTTALVPSAPGAEYVEVSNGMIIYSRFLFDRVPFEAARRAAMTGSARKG